VLKETGRARRFRLLTSFGHIAQEEVLVCLREVETMFLCDFEPAKSRIRIPAAGEAVSK